MEPGHHASGGCRNLRNGLQITADGTRAIHVGTRQTEGIVRYSADTMDKELALITARARDAVAACGRLRDRSACRPPQNSGEGARLDDQSSVSSV